MQVFQSKILRRVTNAPPHISYRTLPADLHIPSHRNSQVILIPSSEIGFKITSTPVLKNYYPSPFPDCPSGRLKRQSIKTKYLFF